MCLFASVPECVSAFTERAGRTREGGGRKRGVTASSLISEINRAAVDSGVSQIHSRMRSPGEDELKMDVQRL